MGVITTIKTALLFQIYKLPQNTNDCSVFILHVPPVFFFFSCFEQGLCYVYVSESEACFLPARRTDLVAQDSDRTKVILCIYTKC